MAKIQLTQQFNPIAQTFRISEPGGSVITSIGIFFSAAPRVSDDQLPIVLEIRPIVDGGNPSSQSYFDGTQVSASASQIRAVASTTFSNTAEYKFTLREPLYVPENSEVALVLYTSASVGQYKIWVGEVGEFISGSTQKRVTHQLEAGAMFQSSNGTAWNSNQNVDLAFKVYRAVFNATGNYATLFADQPPVKRLTEIEYTNNIIRYPSDPIIFKAGSTQARIVHPAHGFVPGDTVRLTTDTDGFTSSTVINGVLGSNILGSRVIDSADAFGYTITMGSAATATVHGGGTGLVATEQYIMDHAILNIGYRTPPQTSIWATGDFTTTTSLGGEEYSYDKLDNTTIPLNTPVAFKNPMVVATIDQENDITKLNGVPSTAIRIGLDTNNKYVAPYFYVDATSLGAIAQLIDFQDSDLSVALFRNKITTIDYVPETSPNGGTTASKHITVPFAIEQSATSLRVMFDAIRPKNTDFNIWYRTGTTSSTTNLLDRNWVMFEKTPTPPNTSNYQDIGNTVVYREFEFNIFDLPDFDEYQVKITFHSNNSTQSPIFKNLRTIATE